MQASDAVRLSGLTAHQLREWCGRRAVVTPDVPPAGRGRHALFSWHTIIALRVLNELHNRFGVEVIAWREAIAQCQSILKAKSFPSLWGTSVAFPNRKEAHLLRNGARPSLGACVVIELDPHLDVFATEDGLPLEQQLSLFAAVTVKR